MIAILIICALACQPESSSVATVEKSTSDAWDSEKRIEELGITLPTPAVPIANYVNASNSA